MVSANATGLGLDGLPHAGAVGALLAAGGAAPGAGALAGRHSSPSSRAPTCDRSAISPSSWRFSAPSGSSVQSGCTAASMRERPSAVARSQPSRAASIRNALTAAWPRRT